MEPERPISKGIGEGLSVGQCVTSPTFNIMNEYMGRLLFYHMDLYRLGKDADLSELGLDEYFYDKGVVLVEWPELLGEALPSRHIWINMWKCYDHDGNEWRQIELDTIGAPAPWLVEVPDGICVYYPLTPPHRYGRGHCR